MTRTDPATDVTSDGAAAVFVRSRELETALALTRDLTAPNPTTVQQTLAVELALSTTIETFQRERKPLLPLDVVRLCKGILAEHHDDGVSITPDSASGDRGVHKRAVDSARVMVGAYADELVASDYDFEDLFEAGLLRGGRDLTGEGTTPAEADQTTRKGEAP